MKCDELKADKTFVFGEECEAYKKSEADKVIAELKKKLDLYKRGLEEADKINAYLYVQLRHHKYKRCLAMADACSNKLEAYDYKAATEYTDHDVWLIATSYYTIWRKRWLKIAEHFKEAK